MISLDDDDAGIAGQIDGSRLRSHYEGNLALSCNGVTVAAIERDRSYAHIHIAKHGLVPGNRGAECGGVVREARQLGARRCNRAGGGSSVADEPRLADLGSRTLGVGPIPGGCEVRTFGSESEAFDGHGEVGGLPSGNGHVRVAA